MCVFFIYYYEKDYGNHNNLQMTYINSCLNLLWMLYIRNKAFFVNGSSKMIDMNLAFGLCKKIKKIFHFVLQRVQNDEMIKYTYVSFLNKKNIAVTILVTYICLLLLLPYEHLCVILI